MTRAYGGTTFRDDFDGPFPGSWSTRNNSSPVGSGGWGRGPNVTSMQSATVDTSFVTSCYEAASAAEDAKSVSVVSDWLISPPVALANGDRLSFAACAFLDQSFPDRLQLRLNLANQGDDVGSTPDAVGDFTFLALDINPQYASDPADGAFPVEWTNYSYSIDGLARPTVGRFAFRYLLTDTGWQGNEVGVDDVRLTTTSTPEPATGGLAVVAIAYAAYRRPERHRSGHRPRGTGGLHHAT